MRRGILPAIILLLGSSSLASPTLRAQTCQALPAEENEIWIGGGVQWNGQAGEVGGRLVGNVADFLGVELGAGTGGYQGEADSPQEVHVRISPLLGIGSIQICPLAEVRSHSRDIRSSFRVDRGRIEEMGFGFGTVVAGRLPALLGSRLGWQATTGLWYRDWDMKGRRLLVEDEISVEEVRWVRHSTHLFGSVGLSARFGPLGLVAGVGARPHNENDLFGFLSFGFRFSG